MTVDLQRFEVGICVVIEIHRHPVDHFLEARFLKTIRGDGFRERTRYRVWGRP